ncbi:MAG: hypothetical protein KIT34_18845 [Cyanobacteria bacterium TGS_CYA1]|nr:hypothetical protein [Cyanobacteria bacterium TGS_CYA1]
MIQTVQQRDASTTQKQEHAIRTKSGYGKLPSATNFSSKARQKIMDAIPIFGTGTDHVKQVELTIPGSTASALKTFASWSSYALNRFTQFLRRKIGVNCKYLYVWEFQSRGALHLHFIISDTAEKMVFISEAQVRELWYEVLISINEKSGKDVFERVGGGSWKDDSSVLQVKAEDCDNAKKRCFYLSKDETKVPITLGSGETLSPGRWWGMSKTLRKHINQILFKLTFEATSDQSRLLFEIAKVQLGGTWHAHFNAFTQKQIGWQTYAHRNLKNAIKTLNSLYAGSKPVRAEYTYCPGKVTFKVYTNGHIKLAFRNLTAREFLKRHADPQITGHRKSIGALLVDTYLKNASAITFNCNISAKSKSGRGQQAGNQKKQADRKQAILSSLQDFRVENNGIDPTLNVLSKRTKADKKTVKKVLKEEGIELKKLPIKILDSENSKQGPSLSSPETEDLFLETPFPKEGHGQTGIVVFTHSDGEGNTKTCMNTRENEATRTMLIVGTK